MNHIYVNGHKHVYFARRLWSPVQQEIAGGLTFIILAALVMWLCAAL